MSRLMNEMEQKIQEVVDRFGRENMTIPEESFYEAASDALYEVADGVDMKLQELRDE